MQIICYFIGKLNFAPNKISDALWYLDFDQAYCLVNLFRTIKHYEKNF